jgi:hypothetical protein
MNKIKTIILTFTLIIYFLNLAVANGKPLIHPWEMYEIVLKSEKSYYNYYADVTCWVELRGPGFSKRVYGFWDGNHTFIVRIVATKPGTWEWTSGSNQPNDKGLNNQSWKIDVTEWTREEIEQNPNRRGFIRPATNGHALQYADSTLFFMLGDTWLAGTTWRLPYRNSISCENYTPGPGIGFEDAVTFRKKQGFNSVSMISCFPNWESDSNPSTYADSNGIYLRNAWEKFGYFVGNGKMTSKNMNDEYGNLPFRLSEKHQGVSDFDNIVPEYFQSLDKKMKYLSDQGFVALLETVRRDVCPSWKAYFDFNKSYARFFQYIIARYGAYNIIFSGIHLDWIPKEYSLTGDEFNEALTYHLKEYGAPAFGQLVTTLISSSTYSVFGHNENCPWLTMHSVGNKPRDHRVSDSLEILFNLKPPYPAINFEPYYTGWDHEINNPGGERPPVNSKRDNYFSRAQMYGSVLSGGLSGHVHGTAAYDITSTGEPKGVRPHFWEALQYESGYYMQYLSKFILSEGKKYQELQPASKNLLPQKASGSPEMGLDGWSYMMRNKEKDFALLYFENQSALPEIKGFKPNVAYVFRWYNTLTGEWFEKQTVKSDKKGTINTPMFPDGRNPSIKDWAAKIIEK